MITTKKLNIPIFNYKLTVYITDTFEELESKLPRQDMDLSNTRAITLHNNDIGGAIVAVKSGCQSSVVHEALHVKNAIWEWIGYNPQADNDEVDAYLLTYIYEKIMEVFKRHNSTTY